MLKMRDVTKHFGSFRALDSLTLTVPKGAVYGLVGPNGAGKSTAIRHLTGVYRPDAGQVLLNDAPVFENPDAKERLCCIGDEVFFFPSATLTEMRDYYAGIYPRFDKELFEKLFEVFQLPKKGQLRRFSKGMQKQAAFQLSLCTHPEVLILDEPVDGLDPVMRRQVWSLLLSQVAEYETTVLVSSHNLRELEDICDHVGIMDKGRMLLERSLADMQGSNVKVQLAGDIPQGLNVLHESLSGRLRTLIVQGTAEKTQQLLQAADPAYFDVLPLSLEEIFIYELGGVNDAVKTILL